MTREDRIANVIDGLQGLLDKNDIVLIVPVEEMQDGEQSLMIH